jgi:ankyrin repeat protein
MSLDQTSRTTEKRADETAPHGTQFVLRRGKLLLTDDEQNIWEDLIDESQLSQPSREIPLYPEISLLKRPCCEMKVSSSCTRCGFSEVHCWAVTAVTEPYVAVPFPSSFSADFKNERDYFGNTPLHFAAANATGSITTGWRTIKWLIHKGANVGARNTSGETFMHVLHRELLKCTERYSELLLLLAKLGFPFSQRDHHGQTLAEIFFATVNPQDIQLGHFRIIFSHLLFDIHEKYVTDFWARTVGDNETLQESRCVGARNLASLVAQGYKPLPSFQNANFWSTGPDLSDIGKGIDVNGNSALIYIVKAWREAHDDRQLSHILKSLVSAGADIAMRDRHGDTALAVAARRGLRPAVKTLLCCGANPNTRNYRGRGVLEGAREGLKRARKEDKSRRYAMAVSCVALLVDYGAVEQPTAYDEFVSPTARAKVQGAPGFV